MKKILSLILSTAMLISGAVLTASAEPASSSVLEASGEYAPNSAPTEMELNADQKDSQGIYYTLDDEAMTAVVGKNTYADSASAGEPASDSIVIPGSVTLDGKSYAVSAIGRNAFDGTTVREVIIASSVKTIGEFAFAGCASLERVETDATEIKGFAFWQCIKLNFIRLNKAETIGGGAFWNCTSLNTVVIEDAKTIMEKAFDGCTNLKTIVAAGMTAPAVAADALGTTATLLISADASGYDSLGLETRVAEGRMLYVADTYVKAGGSAYVTVYAPVGMADGDVSLSVSVADVITVTGIKSDLGLTYNEGVITGTVTESYNGIAVATLEVQLADEAAAGRYEITVSAEGYESGVGAAVICSHENTKEVIVKGATCEEAGEAKVVCTVCGEIVGTKSVEAADHDYKTFVINPTCTEGGYTRHICDRCGHKYTDAEVDALGHDWDEGEVLIEASTKKEGLIKYTCQRCGITRQEIMPKIVYGDANVDGKVGTDDAVLMLKVIAEWNLTGQTYNEINADVNVDGNVNINDVALVLKYIAGWNVVLGPAN